MEFKTFVVVIKAELKMQDAVNISTQEWMLIINALKQYLNLFSKIL